ncbi:hypothetical protein [Hymenobacter metallilatus]|uniref:Uncharacterized protein n=1 Tax=Hymenobacter metallilatus TaxID=2493666 RepID=A0A3R9NJL1_9BACT|nr:hypothetical protein [Hymenobacter metallilatus]RSK34686.1 hypothetical protein EI290_08700 [Hymenobacter metallilatus]
MKKYLFIRLTAAGTEFHEATYLFAEAENQATTDRAFFAAFTGLLRLHNLTTGQELPFFYRLGQRQPGPLPAAGTLPPGNGAKPSSCYAMVYCDWTGVCSEVGPNPMVYGSSTFGVNYCQTPSDDGVGCSRIVWSLIRSNSMFYCQSEDPPTDPGTPGEPGSPPDPTSPQPPKTPCQTMQTATQAKAYQDNVARLKYLSNNPPRDANGKPLETGITYLDPADLNTYRIANGTEDNIEVGVAPGGLVAGFMHDHPPGDGTLPLFSPSDLYSICKLLITSPPVIDPSAYTTTVIIHNGQSYMLTITDPAAFIAFGKFWFEDQFFADKLVAEYYNEKTGGIGSSTNGITGNEKAFFNMRKREGMGLALFKQDSSNNSWQQLALNPVDNIVTSSPCS